MASMRIRAITCLSVVLAAQSLALAQAPPLRHDLSLSPCSGPSAVAFSPDGRLFACYRNRGDLRLWDTTTGELLDIVETSAGVNSFVSNHGMVFSPDGRTLAVGVWSGIQTTGHIYFWGLRDGVQLGRSAELSNDDDKGVLALAFLPDGQTLLSVGHGDHVRAWDLARGEARALPLRHDEQISMMALSSDGNMLVTGDSREVKVWDLGSNEETISWNVPDLTELALSPDGRVLAAGSFPEGGVTFWDVATGNRRHDLQPLPDATGPMVFSPDGRRFVTVNRDRCTPSTVTITDLTPGGVLAKYTHPGQLVSVVAWSPDGTLLASGDFDELAGAQVLLRDVSGFLRE